MKSNQSIFSTIFTRHWCDGCRHTLITLCPILGMCQFMKQIH